MTDKDNMKKSQSALSRVQELNITAKETRLFCDANGLVRLVVLTYLAWWAVTTHLVIAHNTEKLRNQ
jgi:hypothetical protein